MTRNHPTVAAAARAGATIVFCFMISVLSCGPTARAQSPGGTAVEASTAAASRVDRVWIAPPAKSPQSDTQAWYPSPIRSYRGRVVGFDAQQLVLDRTGDQAELTLAAERVIRIDLGNLDPSQAKLIQAFDSGQFKQCLAYLPEVLRARPPVWRQQWLTMLSASAAKRIGRHEIALELVSQLDRRPLPSMVTAWLPIDWSPTGRAAAANANRARAAAMKRLDDQSAFTRLVAASWLLGTPDRAVAVKQLQSLSRLSSPARAGKLAEVLLWTTQTPPQVARSQSAWLADLEKLPMILQVGPAIALQRKFEASGLKDPAKWLGWSNQLTPIDQRITRFLLQK